MKLPSFREEGVHTIETSMDKLITDSSKNVVEWGREVSKTSYMDEPKVVPEGWAVTVSRLTLAVIFSITPFLYQSSSVCYAHSQMQKRSMVYLFWTMGYSDQAIRNKTFNSN